MADCNETLRELDAFLDSQAAERTRLAIRWHLGGCPRCLPAFARHAVLKIVVRQKCRTDEMPSGLLAKLEACFGGVDELDADDPARDPASGATDEVDPWAATDELDAGPDGA